MTVSVATLAYNPWSSNFPSIISGTITSTVNSNPIQGTSAFSACCLHVKAAASSGTPTFNVYLQQLAVDGLTWYDIASMAQITGNGSYILGMVSGGNSNFTVTSGTLAAGTVLTVPFGGVQRVLVVVGGGTPSATLTIGIEYIE